MNKKIYSIVIDIAGKLMLAWFALSTFRYFYVGRFTEQLHYLSKVFRDGETLWFIYDIFQIPIAAIGIFLLIPLLLKGHVWGLVLGLLYLVMGYYSNPLWFVVPYEMQVRPDGQVTTILEIINYSYSIATLAILLAFYFYRRSLKIKHVQN